MKLHYFPDTDTLYIELHDTPTAEFKDFDENTLLEVDANGNLLAITIEHASERADLPHLTLDGIAA
jgi:uncharacterized protein YuzE